jgi:hypothetical protein
VLGDAPVQVTFILVGDTLKHFKLDGADSGTEKHILKRTTKVVLHHDRNMN